MDRHEDLRVVATSGEDGRLLLGEILAPVWHARTLVTGVTLLAVLFGFAAFGYLAQYKSEGFFQFGGAIPLVAQNAPKEKDLGNGINLADFKRYSAVFSARDRFDGYVREKQPASPHVAAGLRTSFAAPGGIARLVEPVYTFTKLDAKELMEQPKDASNNVIGLRISAEAKHADTAQRMVDLLGRYTMDSIIYLIYSDTLRFKHSELTSKLTALDNDIIDLKQKLEEYRRKGVSLKQIVARYPDSAAQAGRQVVSVTDENARFLSPVTHLMSTEVEASQANEAIIKATRAQQQMRLMLEYFEQAKGLVDSSKSGETILRGLEPIKQKMFKDKDLNDELVKEVYNTITIDNQNALALYLEKSRFIAGPTLPESRSTRLSAVLLISLLAGILLSVAIVFAREWWRNNRPIMVQRIQGS